MNNDSRIITTLKDFTISVEDGIRHHPFNLIKAVQVGLIKANQKIKSNRLAPVLRSIAKADQFVEYHQRQKPAKSISKPVKKEKQRDEDELEF